MADKPRTLTAEERAELERLLENFDAKPGFWTPGEMLTVMNALPALLAAAKRVEELEALARDWLTEIESKPRCPAMITALRKRTRQALSEDEGGAE